MSTDALAALLQECPYLPGTTERDTAWLAARGVVVLSADHPLRTGEPSREMLQAAVAAEGDLMNMLRAALAVLREGL